MATPTNLPAAATAGQVLTAQYVNDLRGAFRVLQVVSATASAQQAGSSSTFADTTLTATITPQSTSSKVLVMVVQAGIQKAVNDTGVDLRLLRDSTVIASIGSSLAGNGTNTFQNIGGTGINLLDSPNTVSATTYKTQYASSANSAFAVVQHLSAVSTIVLMEISA
jgi:hypothetical protein